MKIIDLLNKIANGEEIPKIIKYDDKIYYSNEDRIDLHIYQTEGSTTTRKLSLIIDNEYLGLNEEVEIIEEDKKIEYPILHKTAPQEITGDEMPNWRYLIDCNFEHLNKTIYKLIDEINKLKEE